MRKIITSAMASVLAAGAVLATAAPAAADGRRGYYRHHHRDNDDAVAAAVIGGVAGLALGAALANGDRRGGDYDRRDYDRRYYDRRGYDRGYRYGYSPRYDSYYERPYAYRTCVTRDRVYDPYIGRRVTIERRYAC